MVKLKKQKKPESILQEKIMNIFKLHDWYVRNTHGNIYQSGFPDFYACHTRYGTRWIEVKIANHYSFTPAQMDVFPEFSAKGVGIWILTAATETQYNLIFGPPNWHMFLGVMK
jgi:hypothetical protein